MRAQLNLIAIVLLPLAATSQARAGMEAKATACATIRPNGPRTGTAAKTYVNIEGKNNGNDSMYASFGVVDLRASKPETPFKTIRSATLTLTQSLIRFSKDGPIRIFLATDDQTSIAGENSTLKFDPKVSGGIGEQFKMRFPLGSATFTKKKTGDADSIALALSPEATTHLLAQLNSGNTIRIVIVPADDDVAATYFGSGCETESSRPKLSIEATP